MKYEIHRVSSNKDGTFGIFTIDSFPQCVTLEETWLDNKPQISCIPAGTYKATAYSGTKYKNVWIVNDVPGRSAILIHWGNTEANTAGCILLGKGFADFSGKIGITDSVATYAHMREVLPKAFDLTFTDHFKAVHL